MTSKLESIARLEKMKSRLEHNPEAREYIESRLVELQNYESNGDTRLEGLDDAVEDLGGDPTILDEQLGVLEQKQSGILRWAQDKASSLVKGVSGFGVDAQQEQWTPLSVKYNPTTEEVLPTVFLDEVEVKGYPNATPQQVQILKDIPKDNPIYRNTKSQLENNKKSGNYADEVLGAIDLVFAEPLREVTGYNAAKRIYNKGLKQTGIDILKTVEDAVLGSSPYSGHNNLVPNADFDGLESTLDVAELIPYGGATLKLGKKGVQKVIGKGTFALDNLDDIGRLALGKQRDIPSESIPSFVGNPKKNIWPNMVNKSIIPIGYDPFTVAAAPLELLTPDLLKFKPKTFATKNRFDAWRLYNGLDPEFNTFYKNPDGTLALNSFRIEKAKLQTIVSNPERSFGTMDIEPEFNFGGVHGNGWITKGVDDRSRKFIDFTDLWDIQPLKSIESLPKAIKEFEVSSLTGGKPLHLKNRIYYDDAGNFFDHTGNKLIEETQTISTKYVGKQNPEYTFLSTKDIEGVSQNDVLADWDKAVNNKYVKGSITLAGATSAGLGILNHQTRQKLNQELEEIETTRGQRRNKNK